MGMHMPYSYGSAGIPSNGDVGACKRAHINSTRFAYFHEN